MYCVLYKEIYENQYQVLPVQVQNTSNIENRGRSPSGVMFRAKKCHRTIDVTQWGIRKYHRYPYIRGMNDVPRISNPREHRAVVVRYAGTVSYQSIIISPTNMYSTSCCHPTRSVLPPIRRSLDSIFNVSTTITNADHNRPHHRHMSSSSSTTTTTTTVTKTKSHYEAHSAESYDSAFFYEVGPYMKHLRDLCYNRLQLQVRDWDTPATKSPTTATATTVTVPRILLDIGGGTGTFTRTLISDRDHDDDNNNNDDTDTTNSLPNIEAIVIDPYLEFNSSLENSIHHDDDNKRSHKNVLRFIKAPAEAFILSSTKEPTTPTVTPFPAPTEIELPRQYHQILLKEVIHHFADQDRSAIFHGLYHYGLLPTRTATTGATTPNTTTPIPSILIITRPQYDIDYPLWDDAKTVWAQNQPSLDVLMQELETAGFTSVTHTIESYPCSIPLTRWCSMIQNRFWSTFTNFTDDELQEACHIIATNERHRITKDGMIQFDDRLVFITACKV